MTPDPRILVTGAHGRLGRALRRRLDAEGRTTITLDRVDLADPDALAAAVRAAEPTAILHLASINGAACDVDPARTEAINVAATRIIAESGAEAGARRIVFTSSAAVYGDERDIALRESDPVQPLSRYGASKARAEDALGEVSASAPELQSVALRIFNLYGPGFDHSLVSRILTAAPDDPAVLLGLDSFVRDFVHVDDVVEAILAALDAPTADPHTRINIASGEALTNGELVDRLGSHAPLSYRVAEEQRSYSYANIDLARERLGFRPRRFVGDGRETA